MAENWIQSMNRLTGPAPCQCSITGPHQPGNPYCSRNRSTVHQSESLTKVNGVTDAEIDAEIRRNGCLRTDENRAAVRVQLESARGVPGTVTPLDLEACQLAWEASKDGVLVGVPHEPNSDGHSCDAATDPAQGCCTLCGRVTSDGSEGRTK